MNQTDIKNLKFLLNADTSQLREWYNSASNQELMYAKNLLDQYHTMLDDEIVSMQIEEKLRTMPLWLEAQSVISMVSSK